MRTEDLDGTRLALAEVTCRLAHTAAEASALAEGRAFPAMPADRRASQLSELQATLARLRERHGHLVERVPDPEVVAAADGTLPEDRRRSHLSRYIDARRVGVERLEVRLAYLRGVADDKATPKEVRRRARDGRSMATSELEALRAEPANADLQPGDMCPDWVHLERSHGYVWTVATRATPCPAWPGQIEIARRLQRTLADLHARRREHELTRWRLTLHCGHTVERTAHMSYPTYAAAGGSSRPCEVCGVDPSFVIEELSLEPAGPPPDRRPAPAVQQNRKALERRAGKLEAELASVRARLQDST
jgi:hypothetical protein